MAETGDYIPYTRIIDRIQIAQGDIVVVSSDILSLLLACRKHGESFSADLFIDSLRRKVGHAGTVLFPTFTWEFCRIGCFDIRRTPAMTGALGSAALKRADFHRTRHPIYSFAVAGAAQEELCALDNIGSWAEDSPFGWLYRAHAKNLFVGIDYKLAFTFDHYAEEKVGVDYRFHKTFLGTYTDTYGISRRAEYTMYVRDLSRNIATFISPELDSVLKKAGYYQRWTMNGIPFGLIDLHGACDVMEDDIRSQGHLIYTAPEDSAA